MPNALSQYLDLIVDPTIEEFKRNPTSIRHAYLACLAVYHAIDRVTYPRAPGNLRKKWREQSQDFALIDVIAHDFKHVRSSEHRPVEGSIPLEFGLYGGMGFNSHMLNDTGHLTSLRHIVFATVEALKFLRERAADLEKTPKAPFAPHSARHS